MNPIGWIKNNKLATFLILLVLYFAFIGNRSPRPFIFGLSRNGAMGTFEYSESAPAVGGGDVSFNLRNESFKVMPQMGRPAVGVSPESTALSSVMRRIVTENYLSLQVSDVSQSISQIKSKAESLNGFMVSTNVSRPEEASSGSITIRVPTTEADEMISFLKENSIKVVSEDIQGRDITDQYQDTETRLTTLLSNRSRIQEIMNQATTVEEILKVQTQLFQLQDQIDSLIGQRDYLRETSESVRITAYLSTDEYALPYIPDTSWRPEAVFKEAVRNLILDLRSLGNKLIWIAVYAVIWVPALIIFLLLKRNWRRITTRFSATFKLRSKI